MSSSWAGAGPEASSGIEADLAFAHMLADAADEISRAAFVLGDTLDHDTKPDGTPVSATDKAIEEAVLELVRRHRPGDALLGEEVGAHGGSRRRWIVDGIDGTNNFVTGSPMWGTLIALTADDVPVVGINSSPGQGRRWWAARGHGAWTRDYDSAATNRLTVTMPVACARITACIDPTWETHPDRATMERLVGRVDIVPTTSHPALEVADGAVDLGLHVDGGPWDFAGVMPLVWEAGGRCLGIDGHEAHTPTPPIAYIGAIPPEILRDLFAD